MLGSADIAFCPLAFERNRAVLLRVTAGPQGHAGIQEAHFMTKSMRRFNFLKKSEI